LNIDKKSGPQKRAGRNTGTHRGGSSEGKKRKRAVAVAAAVAEHEPQRRRRPCVAHPDYPGFSSLG
jgi:hypothetical protein